MLAGINSFGSNFQDLFETVSANVYWKDKKSIYLEVNESCIHNSFYKTQDDIVGKSDLDLHWKENAPLLIENDQKVMLSGQTHTYIESLSLPAQNTKTHYLSHKTPLLSRTGKIIGVSGLSFPIHPENSLFVALQEIASQIMTKIPRHKLKNNILNSHTHGLTERQMDCLFHLVQGMTIKQIAKVLHLSPKTVEHYLEATKKKLHCQNRSALISKALNIQVIRDKL